MGEKAVRCPWCGAEMIEDPKSAFGDRRQVDYWYRCDECFSKSPMIGEQESIGETIDKTHAAAQQRYVEPLKPMELHEVTGSEEPCVFLEKKGMEPIWACDCVISSDLESVDISFIGRQGSFSTPISDYGKTWRCWARRPTDKEREAEGWK